MIRQILQTIGIASLTAGIVLFFVNSPTLSKDQSNMDKDAEIVQLKQQLASVKEALADAQKPSQTEEKQDEAQTGSTETTQNDTVVKMILTLSTGDTSKDASDSLEKSGIIESASEFETYLNKQGLAGKIQIGQHNVDSSMDFAALAKELTTVKQ